MTAPLFGLVLAGGRSTRMRRDKAALDYAGTPQLDRAFQLLQSKVAQCFVSVRADQRSDPLRAAYPQIVDGAGPQGPIAGILAAQAAHPDAAWLILACDLPHVDAATLDTLIDARDPGRVATAFRSDHDDLPEPLCSIFEPSSREALIGFVATGRHCPRKFLLESNAKLLPPSAGVLRNVNTSDEYWATANELGTASASRRIRVQYYALLREQAGRSDEVVSTRARTPRELYEELRARHPFTLPPELLRVAVNTEFGDWLQPLVDDDAIVFIPPVAGG